MRSSAGLSQEDQLWHLPAEPGWSVPPSPSSPSLAPPATGAAPVPLAQAAARGRWPWHSRCRPWPAEDAKWHRLRRGLGSSISITPPWEGFASGARSTQEPGTAPAKGTGRGEGLQGRAKPSSCPAVEISRTIHHWPRDVRKGLQDHHYRHQHPSAEHTDWLQPRRALSPWKRLCPRARIPSILGLNSLRAGTKYLSIPMHTMSSPAAHLEHSPARLHSPFEVRNPVFPHS